MARHDDESNNIEDFAARRAEIEQRREERGERERETQEIVEATLSAANELAQYRGAELEIRTRARATELEIKPSILSKEIARIQGEQEDAESLHTAFESNTPAWPDEVNLQELLDDIVKAFRRYLVAR